MSRSPYLRRVQLRIHPWAYVMVAGQHTYPWHSVGSNTTIDRKGGHALKGGGRWGVGFIYSGMAYIFLKMTNGKGNFLTEREASLDAANEQGDQKAGRTYKAVDSEGLEHAKMRFVSALLVAWMPHACPPSLLFNTFAI